MVETKKKIGYLGNKN